MTRPLLLDFETTIDPAFSAGDADAFYIRNCKVVCLGALMPDDSAVVWVPGWERGDTVHTVPGRLTPDGRDHVVLVVGGAECPAAITAPLNPGTGSLTPCAHNARGFDARVWVAKVAQLTRPWVDSMPLARTLGFPGSLDVIGQRLTGKGKDEFGKNALDRLPPSVDFDAPGVGAVRKPFKGLMFAAGDSADGWHAQLLSIIEYNAVDLFLLAELWKRIANYYGDDGQHGPSWEHEVLALDGWVNARGFAYDAQLSRWLQTADAELAHTRAERLPEVCELTAADTRSTKRLHEWLKDSGFPVENCQRATLEELLEDDDVPEEVRIVVETRLGLARTTTAKLQAGDAAALAGGGRVRDSLVYAGAHTWRWAGRKFQPQNLPRPVDMTDAEHARILAALTPVAVYDANGDVLTAEQDLTDLHRLAGELSTRLKTRVMPEALLSSMLRDCITASPGHSLRRCDFASVEARGLCWLADDDERGLAVYRAGGNPYKEMAAVLFKCTPDEIKKGSLRYQLGKILVLACGYGMGATKFEATCLRARLNLAELGITPELAIKTYRARYGAVVEFWYALDDAVKSLAWTDATGLIRVGKHVAFDRDGRDLVCHLPSGRWQIYRNIRRMPDGSPAYDSPRNFDPANPPRLYGGKIAENVTQAVCRDLLAQAMVRASKAGLDVTLHVHDELFVEAPLNRVDEVDAKLLAIMRDVPMWASGFPIEAEAK